MLIQVLTLSPEYSQMHNPGQLILSLPLLFRDAAMQQQLEGLWHKQPLIVKSHTKDDKFPTFGFKWIVYRPLVWAADGGPHPAVTRTLQYPADTAACRKGEQMSARSLQHRWKHEIQIALRRRSAATTRAVLPDPSARAEWLVAGLIDRAPVSTAARWEAMTQTQTQAQTPQHQIVTMRTSLLSPVNNLQFCSSQTSDRCGAACSLMYQHVLELDALFDDHYLQPFRRFIGKRKSISCLISLSPVPSHLTLVNLHFKSLT